MLHGLYTLRWQENGTAQKSTALYFGEAVKLISRIQRRGVFSWTLSPYQEDAS